MATTATLSDVSPALPSIPLKLGATTYQLCFTFGAIRLAEMELRKLGQEVDLLANINPDSFTATTLVPLLYAALNTHQPEITPLEVVGFIKLPRIPKIRKALWEALIASFADVDEDAEPVPLDEE